MDNTASCAKCGIYAYFSEYAKSNKSTTTMIQVYASDFYAQYSKWARANKLKPASAVLFGVFAKSIADQKLHKAGGNAYFFDGAKLQTRVIRAKFQHEHGHRLGTIKHYRAIKRDKKASKVIQLEVEDKMLDFPSFLDSKLVEFSSLVSTGCPVDDLEVMVTQYMRDRFSEFFESQQKGR